MLLGTRAMMLRQCVGCTAMGRRSLATFTDWFLITPWKRKSMTARSPSRGCQVGLNIRAVCVLVYLSLYSLAPKSNFCGFDNAAFCLMLKSKWSK